MSRPVNIYELLDDDSGPKGPATQQQKPKAAAQTTQPKATTQANRAPARSQDRKPREDVVRGGYNADQVTERRPRGERPDRTDRKGGEFTEVRAPRNPNQRQYDRKSGTGRGREGKRSGGGRGNWGTVSDETKPAEEGEKVEEVAQTTEAAPVEATTEAVAEEKVEEEEEKSKTLDEYLNSIKKVSISLPAPRQAGEGQEVSPQWASYTALKKTDEDEVISSKFH
jgi:plasminogen activator inhibitor 1 RNA-binding protein